MTPIRVLVTRPQPQADDWVARLVALGVDAAALPLLAIGDAPDPAAVVAAWRGLERQALAMFVSASAVERFAARRAAAMPWPPGTLAGSTGPGTARALRAAGVPPACIVTPHDDAPSFDSEVLWELLRPMRDWRGASVLVVRGEGGRDWLAERLRAAGAAVEFVAAYRRLPPEVAPAQQRLLDAALAHPGDHVWLFSSAEGVGRLGAIAPAADWSASCALATHPRIAEAARAVGFTRLHSVAPTPQAVAAAVSGTTPPIQWQPT